MTNKDVLVQKLETIVEDYKKFQKNQESYQGSVTQTKGMLHKKRE